MRSKRSRQWNKRKQRFINEAMLNGITYSAALLAWQCRLDQCPPLIDGRIYLFNGVSFRGSFTLNMPPASKHSQAVIYPT